MRSMYSGKFMVAGLKKSDIMKLEKGMVKPDGRKKESKVRCGSEGFLASE